GVGFLTFLGHGTLVVVTVGAAATGRPLLGALVLAPFGVARGLAPLVALRSGDREDGRILIDRLNAMPERTRSIANGVAIVAVVAAAAAVGVPARGGWGRAAGAAVAVAFAWAAASKLVSMPRWRRALAAHRLASPLRRTATWAVPLVELVVPVLALAGHARAAAAVALAALAAFTATLVRARLRGGSDVPCGCFGRESVDVRTALARNVGLGALAAGSWWTAGPDPAIAAPSGGDLLPAALAAGALLAALATAWRASAWFSRGRG
ncbi:MAG TPA: MauE/DoxX family redox-associated membrane protein, partial [Actinomycetota bacterium]|nr:MauE/DoxX family redox-associated membrane protein [Actinomycetota bacterium]